jgi:glucose-6-phosphate isomerase
MQTVAGFSWRYLSIIFTGCKGVGPRCALLDGLDLRRAFFNVIDSSGDTPATLAQFLWVYNLLKNRFGEDKAKERLVNSPYDGAIESVKINGKSWRFAHF